MIKDFEVQAVLFPECPVRNIIARVGDKWSLLVLHTLCNREGNMRFSALRKSLPDISQKVLSMTLHHLEEDGMVQRFAFPEVPPRVEYAITQRGLSFMHACRPMIDWALANFADIIESRKRHS